MTMFKTTTANTRYKEGGRRRRCCCTVAAFFLLCILFDLSDAFVLLPLSYTTTSLTRHQERTPSKTISTVGFLAAAKNYDDDDDDEPPDVDMTNAKAKMQQLSNNSFGLGKGRSQASLRKAIGVSAHKTATVYVCQNCGAESLVWRGKCPTCNEWNSLQECQVPRSSAGSSGGIESLLSSSARESSSFSTPSLSSSTSSTSSSWLDGIPNNYKGFVASSSNKYNQPTSIADIVDLSSKQGSNNRIVLPDDDEFNQVLCGGGNDENNDDLGGGIVQGSLILLGGDPGVGKSTLALQVAISIASMSKGIGMGTSSSNNNIVGPVWYVSGEETLPQIASRAQRLVESKLPSQLFLLSETNLNVLSDQVVQAWMLAQNNQGIDSDNAQSTQTNQALPSLIVIDSIQTMTCEQGGMSSAGGMVQVRECMALLLRLAKTTDIPILTIGHVTKEGAVAGPKMVEHMVDAVLYLEHDFGNSNNYFRWLRAQKNRFGSCQTVGLYDFQGGRLVPMPEGATAAQSSLPSTDMEGSALSICLEGQHRALTVEVQALVTVASASFGKKTTEGIPFSRLSLLLGVLQKHCQLSIAGSGKGVSRDVYVNVVGSVSKSQQALAAPALDLAVAMALTSSHLRIPVRGDTAFIAQIGLLGELRQVQSLEARLLQAQRMGFSRVILAAGSTGKGKGKGRRKGDSSGVQQYRKYDMDVFECAKLSDALDLGLVARIPKRKSPTRRSKGGGSTTKSPVSVEELYLDDNVILDDEDDENDLAL